MPASEPPTTEVFLSVIATLQAELTAQREQAARQSKQADEARREIARLVKMVEGLTGQLDLLLHDRNEERRAELAKLREEARVALGVVPPTAGPVEPAAPAKKKSGGKRDEHGRKPIPPQLPRETTRVKPEQCSSCGSSRLNQKKVLVSESWDYVRAQLRVRRAERVACECLDCFASVVPEQPPMPFERPACTFSMMAWLCFAPASPSLSSICPSGRSARPTRWRGYARTWRLEEEPG